MLLDQGHVTKCNANAKVREELRCFAKQALEISSMHCIYEHYPTGANSNDTLGDLKFLESDRRTLGYFVGTSCLHVALP
jgi:hypothetical protein